MREKRPYAKPAHTETPLTIGKALAAQAARTPDAGAIAAPGRVDCPYTRLAAHVDDSGAALRALGLGRRDRIALVLPTGPEMAVAFLAIAASAVCAPLNPSYRPDEYEAYFAVLNVKAVMIQTGEGAAAAAAARRLHLPVIQLSPRPVAAAGLFAFAAAGRLPVDADDYPSPDDVAVVMLTSGTTARPKVVPLTHRNVLASALYTGRAVALTPSDRCLNVAPLFHIHGLCMVLSSLLAGASVVCPPTFDALRFFAWLDECRPTWYVAGPTAHREILTVADTQGRRAMIARCPLRLIRSGSASLPSAVLTPVGREGEIVARGPNIMAGYEGDDAANEDAFVGGWFRTGDLGYLDSDGYLFITGRVKELINRGGQKVSPYEVEAALLDHPAIVQAVAFAAPHATLGEDVAAAVVVRAGVAVTERELRAHVAARLALFKVPWRVVIVDCVPVGATGKAHRIGLAERLGLPSNGDSGDPYVAPRTATERQLALIWTDILGVADIGVTADFYALGGHSLQAARMLDLVGRARGRHISPAAFFTMAEPTVERLAVALDCGDKASEARHPHLPHLVAVRPQGTKRPFFYLTGDNAYYLTLSRLLDPERPFYVLEPHDAHDLPGLLTIEAMAADHVRALQSVQPHGPYLLGGYSNGGLIAYEMARLLRAQGQRVALLVLVDVAAWNAPFAALRPIGRLMWRGLDKRADAFVRARASVLTLLQVLRYAPFAEKRARIGRAARRVVRGAGDRLVRGMTQEAAMTTGGERTMHDEWLVAYKRAMRAYLPGRYDGCVTLLRAGEGVAQWVDDPTARWRYVAAEVTTHDIPGSHSSCVRAYVQPLAARIQQCLDSVE
ncbi:MAG: AMP-binding protein [Chloroflexi bacterium]|nr:AMP-binding protein [Chloroflexota bacterium]